MRSGSWTPRIPISCPSGSSALTVMASTSFLVSSFGATQITSDILIGFAQFNNGSPGSILLSTTQVVAKTNDYFWACLGADAGLQVNVGATSCQRGGVVVFHSNVTQLRIGGVWVVQPRGNMRIDVGLVLPFGSRSQILILVPQFQPALGKLGNSRSLSKLRRIRRHHCRRSACSFNLSQVRLRVSLGVSLCSNVRRAPRLLPLFAALVPENELARILAAVEIDFTFAKLDPEFARHCWIPLLRRPRPQLWHVAWTLVTPWWPIQNGFTSSV